MISSKERTDLEKFLKIRFLPPCRPYRKFQKSAIFGQKNFQAKILSPCLFYNAWAIFWRFQARKGQIWKNFSKSDFCPHAGPIENSKNQPYLVKKIFKLKSYLLVFSTMPFWRFQARKGQIWKNFSKSDFCPHAGPIENSKNQPYLVKKIFKLKSYLLVFSTMPER